MRLRIALGLLFWVTLFLGSAQADLVFVNIDVNSGNGLTAGQYDTNFRLIDNRNATPVDLGNPMVVNDKINYGSGVESAFPFMGHRWLTDTNAWIADDSTSQWLAIQSTYAPPAVGQHGLSDPSGWYTFEYTFTLPNTDAATNASIAGLWAADDLGRILINGTEVATCASPCYNAWSAFDVTSGFVAGVNHLQFRVYNSPGEFGNPVGFRVQMSQFYFYDTGGPSGVPEPITMGLAGTALAGLYLLRRRLAS